MLTLDGGEQLHYLSIKSLEKIPRPIFAARSPLSSRYSFPGGEILDEHGVVLVDILSPKE